MDCQVLNERHLIMTLTDVFSADECGQLIDRAESQNFSDAPITTATGFVHRPDIRNNTRIMLDDDSLAQLMWDRVRHAIPQELGGFAAVGLNERLRFYRYDVGQAFRWHYDGAFRRSPVEQSQLTLMVYLNDDFRGGATEFRDGPVVVPKQGMALLFLHPVLHQGAEVQQGRKYVLRSDVMYRRGQLKG